MPDAEGMQMPPFARSSLPLTTGPFTNADALKAGYTRGLIRHLVECGRWKVLRRGVFCEDGPPTRADPVWLRAAAALLVMAAGSALSHETAEAFHDLPHGREPLLAGQVLVYLTRPATSRNGRHLHPGIVERAASLPAAHVTTKHGLRTTTVARTVIDLARCRPFDEGVILADAALHLGATTHAELVAVRDACNSWPGIGRAAKVVAFADGAAESPLESHSRVALAHGGLPAPTLQAEILLRDGGRLRVDFLWAQWRVIGEADGRIKYQRPDDLWREKLREDALRELGYEVVRWTWDEIVNHPEVVVARILRAANRARLRV
jgi:hypothetical protein